MCDCAETMRTGERFMTREGIRTVRAVTESQVVATIDGDGPLIEGKYNLTDIHRLNCPDGGYPY
jgi:hypothetical protein